MNSFCSVVCSLVVLVLAGCGNPSTTIRVSNKADGTETHISVTQGQGGTTSVTVNPSLNAALDSISFDISKSTRKGEDTSSESAE